MKEISRELFVTGIYFLESYKLFVTGIYFLESYILLYFAVGKMMNNESWKFLACILKRPLSLSNSRWHSVNANVIADVKSKLIVSHQHFFANVIFSATLKVQSYQNKTR